MNVSYLNTSVLKFDPSLNDPGFESDVVILDLEDGVHTSAKGQARSRLLNLRLDQIKRKDISFGVRINSINSIDGIRDLEVIYSRIESGIQGIDFVQIPKVRTHYDVLYCKDILRSLGDSIQLIPIIELPEAIEYVEKIAEVSDAMMFGQVDMVAAMYQPNESYLTYARGRFCVACARAGISAIDTAKVDAKMNLRDMSEFERECLIGKNEGFTAKAVIHPSQVKVVNQVFRIDDLEIKKYVEIIERYNSANVGFSLSDGAVVAPPFVAKAGMMLQLYGYKAKKSKSENSTFEEVGGREVHRGK